MFWLGLVLGVVVGFGLGALGITIYFVYTFMLDDDSSWRLEITPIVPANPLALQ